MFVCETNNYYPCILAGMDADHPFYIPEPNPKLLKALSRAVWDGFYRSHPTRPAEVVMRSMEAIKRQQDIPRWGPVEGGLLALTQGSDGHKATYYLEGVHAAEDKYHISGIAFEAHPFPVIPEGLTSLAVSRFVTDLDVRAVRVEAHIHATEYRHIVGLSSDDARYFQPRLELLSRPSRAGR